VDAQAETQQSNQRRCLPRLAGMGTMRAGCFRITLSHSQERTMTEVIRDPDGLEAQYMRRFAGPSGEKVLEIGCGDGRVTWQYGPHASAVYGVDPNLDKLRRALIARPPSLAAKAHFAQSMAEALPFADDSFGLAIMSWSL
jgi:SAM-dependent methyltransferase